MATGHEERDPERATCLFATHNNCCCCWLLDEEEAEEDHRCCRSIFALFFLLSFFNLLFKRKIIFVIDFVLLLCFTFAPLTSLGGWGFSDIALAIVVMLCRCCYCCCPPRHFLQENVEKSKKDATASSLWVAQKENSQVSLWTINIKYLFPYISFSQICHLNKY